MRHLARRLAQILPTMLGALVLVFLVMRVLPGDPAIALLGTAIWSIKRHKDPHLVLDTDAPLDRLVASLSGMALGMAGRRQSGSGTTWLERSSA